RKNTAMSGRAAGLRPSEYLPRDGCVMSVFLASSLFLSHASGRPFPTSEPAAQMTAVRLTPVRRAPARAAAERPAGLPEAGSDESDKSGRESFVQSDRRDSGALGDVAIGRTDAR